MTPNDARLAISATVDPMLGTPLGDIVTAVTVEPQTVKVSLVYPFPVGGYGPTVQALTASALTPLGWTGRVEVELRSRITGHAAQKGMPPLPGIANIIAVASGKGGVGKSTTAANLALALSLQGARVGLLDADIYGPSQPLMMGLAGQRPRMTAEKKLIPPSAHGVVVMSIGFLIDESQPMVWRGPMVTQALTQLLGDTLWGELDYLIVDLPPGTGDTQLTLAQRVPVSGVVIVTTPQEIALLDARKGLQMFKKVEVPVLGLIENMSSHICAQCGHEDAIFGEGGGQRLADQFDVPMLGSLPLQTTIREQADIGAPTVIGQPASLMALRYHDIARRTAARLESMAAQSVFPTLSESDD